MKNSKFVFDKFTKLLEQGLVSSRDLKNEIVNILKSKRDEICLLYTSPSPRD